MQTTLNPRRRLGGLLATIAVLVTPLAAVTVASATPANAAGCYSTGCHGYDPNVKSCTVSSQKSLNFYSGRTVMATLTNKFSIACDSNWAQAQLTQYAVNLGWNFRVYIDTTDSNGQGEAMCYDGLGSYSNTGWLVENCFHNPAFQDNWTNATWTDMVDGTHITYSYLELYDAHGNYQGSINVNQ